MILDDTQKEIEKTFRTMENFSSSRQWIISEAKIIVGTCRASISASHSANAAIPGNEDKKLSEAQENAEKAAGLLRNLQQKIKREYGKTWRQDLNEYLKNSEQEVVEAFSLLSIIKKKKIPSKEIIFRIKKPGSYMKTKSTVKVSDEGYIFGLLDCVGELKRVIIDLQNRNDMDSSKEIFALMQNLFKMLEPFTNYSNSFTDLKPKIDSARYSLNDAKRLQ